MEKVKLERLIGKEQTAKLELILTCFPDTPIHITGKQGPTGKSTLCNALKAAGFKAFEEWEFEGKDKDDSNAVYIEIALNKPIALS